MLSTASPVSPTMKNPGSVQNQPRLRPSPPRGRPANGPLRLNSLPRFHPANFPSQHSSMANTPGTNVNSPQPPVSPRTQQRQIAEAHRQLYHYQRELFSTSGRAASKAGPGASPASPRLAPAAGSPGPVTPLALEEQDGYLAAGSGSPTSRDGNQSERCDKPARDEARWSIEHSTRVQTGAAGR